MQGILPFTFEKPLNRNTKMKLKTYSAEGLAIEEEEILDFPSFEGDKGLAVLKQTVDAYQHHQRQGNACTKMYGEVRGSGKKPWRQKGTGRARHGSRRSPIWTGGAVVFGPRPRSYRQKLNQKVKQLAFKRALFERAKIEDLLLIESFELSEPKTKLFVSLLNKFIGEKESVLIVDKVLDEKVILAARNIKRVFMATAASINAGDLLCFDKILVTKKGMEHILHRIQ